MEDVDGLSLSLYIEVLRFLYLFLCKALRMAKRRLDGWSNLGIMSSHELFLDHL